MRPVMVSTSSNNGQTRPLITVKHVQWRYKISSDSLIRTVSVKYVQWQFSMSDGSEVRMVTVNFLELRLSGTNSII